MPKSSSSIWYKYSSSVPLLFSHQRPNTDGVRILMAYSTLFSASCALIRNPTLWDCSVEGVRRQFMMMQRTVTLHSKESAIVRCVIADSKH